MSDQPRQPIGRALLHLLSDLTAEVDAFTRWCDTVHHAEALEVDGFVSGRRFELVPGYRYAAAAGARFLTAYQLADEHVLDTDSYRDHVARTTPAPPGVMESLTYTRTIYRERYPDGGWLSPDGTVERGDQPIGAAILHVMMDVEPAWDAELNAWYAEEHLPALLEVPGMLGARRYVDANWPSGGVTDADGRHQYLAVYELVAPEVVDSEEYAKAAAMSPRTADLAPHISFYSQVYRQVFPASGALTRG
jgi:hypothetical protein